jgi:hypothetical protein
MQPPCFSPLSPLWLQARFGHAWTERSKMLCRFLLGVLQRHAGQTQRAEDGLKYVVAAGNIEQLP